MNKRGYIQKGVIMRHILLATLAGGLFLTASALAQTAFWSYDENDLETPIPAQCDGQFDETHGGVFMPTPDELFEHGESFLLEKGPTRKNAAYCLLSAAIQGHVKAQYRIAQLYNKGLVLPQNDIAAYRWAFLASLNGNKEAEQLALTLEQLLTAGEIELATKTVEPMLPTIKQNSTNSLTEQDNILIQKKEKLEEINQEIDDLLGVEYQKPQMKTIEDIRAEAQRRVAGSNASDSSDTVDTAEKKDNQNNINRKKRQTANKPAPVDKIFNEQDRMK